MSESALIQVITGWVRAEIKSWKAYMDEGEDTCDIYEVIDNLSDLLDIIEKLSDLEETRPEERIITIDGQPYSISLTKL